MSMIGDSTLIILFLLDSSSTISYTPREVSVSRIKISLSGGQVQELLSFLTSLYFNTILNFV
jgi:hypothetical protein